MPLLSAQGTIVEKLTTYINGVVERLTSAVFWNIRALAEFDLTDSYLILSYNNFHLQHDGNRLFWFHFIFNLLTTEQKIISLKCTKYYILTVPGRKCF